jgi:hypothetical protein
LFSIACSQKDVLSVAGSIRFAQQSVKGGIRQFWKTLSLMTSLWRKHLIICLFLGLLAVPIYFPDLASTGGGGGNWITLDFRGLIFWTYITLLAIHVALSSTAVLSFPKSGALCIHFWSMVLSVILLVAGFVVYGKLLRAGAISSRQRTLMEKSLKRWCYLPDDIYEERRWRESNPRDPDGTRVGTVSAEIPVGPKWCEIRRIVFGWTTQKFPFSVKTAHTLEGRM